MKYINSYSLTDSVCAPVPALAYCQKTASMPASQLRFLAFHWPLHTLLSVHGTLVVDTHEHVFAGHAWLIHTPFFRCT